MEIKNKARGICVLAMVVLSFFLARECFSFTISISNPTVRVKVEKGDTVPGTIKVQNPSSKEVKVKVYVEDFLYVVPYDGTKKFLPAGSTSSSCAKWISFYPQEFTLAPFGQQNLDYAIKVPPDAQGGRYAVLFFETSLGRVQNEEGANLAVLGRIGSLFFVELEDSLKEAEINELKGKINKIEGEITNSGEIFMKCEGTYFIIEEGDMVVDRGKIKDTFLPPQGKAIFEIDLSGEISSALHTIICTFNLQAGDFLVREIDFIKDSSGNIKLLEIRD